MNRRHFLLASMAGVVAAPLAADAQQVGRVYRLGLLYPIAPAPTEKKTSAVLIPAALRESGYVEGQNLVVERRYAEGRIDRFPGLARELVRLRMDVILAITTAAIRAARDATSTIPIVLYGNVDPVAAGFVTNLARPGGNITGVVIAPGGTLAGKKLELLKEAVPNATRIVLLAPADPGFSLQAQEVEKAALPLGVKLTVVEVRDRDYGRAFTTLATARPDALFVGANAQFYIDRKQIIELAAKHRLPAIYEWPEQGEDGGLMGYGTSLLGLSRRAASYIDRIFKGMSPGDLPIEQPTTLELVINLKTAKALGLTIPPSLLARADQVIE
ncbi:MAG TPA: ABC transporter substrate-binding protein [Gaiellales bacterium]|nr:ABC transporter substrate-binding protein [Gaiellales bacterium]